MIHMYMDNPPQPLTLFVGVFGLDASLRVWCASSRLDGSSGSRTAGQGSLVDEADAALAFCRFSMGDAPGAGEMYMEVLQRTAEKHVKV